MRWLAWGEYVYSWVNKWMTEVTLSWSPATANCFTIPSNCTNRRGIQTQDPIKSPLKITPQSTSRAAFLRFSYNLSERLRKTEAGITDNASIVAISNESKTLKRSFRGIIKPGISQFFFIQHKHLKAVYLLYTGSKSTKEKPEEIDLKRKQNQRKFEALNWGYFFFWGFWFRLEVQSKRGEGEERFTCKGALSAGSN